IILSFSILWSSRPIFVSSNSSFPHSTELASDIVLMSSTIRARAATPFCLSCRKPACAAAHASLASWYTPNLPPPTLFPETCPLPGRDSFAGAVAGLWPSLPSTSATTSRIRASLTVLIGSLFSVVNLFAQHIYRIHDPNHHGVHRRILQVRGQ